MTMHVLIYWQHDRKHGREVGCCLQEYLAFMESLYNELILLVIEFHNSLLEVPHTSMDKLGGF